MIPIEGINYHGLNVNRLSKGYLSIKGIQRELSRVAPGEINWFVKACNSENAVSESNDSDNDIVRLPIGFGGPL